MFRGLNQLKTFSKTVVHMQRSFKSNIVHNLEASQGGSNELWRSWVGKIPAYEEEIKQAVEHLKRTGEPVDAPNIRRAIQRESDRRTKEMKAKRDPYAW